MFGYVTANYEELSKQQRDRYSAVYCGICRAIGQQASGVSRLVLSYDMAFLALLLMSLYEPEEASGKTLCVPHPVTPHPWIDNDIIRYCADMNVALAHYNCLDDWQDDRKPSAKLMADMLAPHCEKIARRWPRQCSAIRDSIAALTKLEAENCSNPDEPAGTFGRLMAELLVYREDLWAESLREMGFALGRFVYLVDAVMDYPKDKQKGKYNPLSGSPESWEEYLVLAMARCTCYYEKLPLVQDKALLDNILYSGVWVRYRGNNRKEKHHD